MLKNFSIHKKSSTPIFHSKLNHWLTHSHAEYELNLYVKVKATFFINETGYFVNDNDILFIPANIEHRIYLSDNYPYTRFVINFNKHFINWCSQVIDIQSFIDTLCDRSYHKISLDFNNYMMVQKLYNDIFEDYYSLNNPDVVVNFYKLLKFIACDDNHLKTNNKINEITVFLDENYKDNISLDHLSELFHMNPSYISRLFKKQTGLTITHYLQYRRILAAHNLITYDKADITTACYESGFGSIQHFYRIYKRLIGHPPNEKSQTL